MKNLIELRDVHVYGGLLLVAGGAWWIYPPAGLITLGFGLIGIVVAFERRRSKED